MVARLTPDQKVACSNHVRVKCFCLCSVFETGRTKRKINLLEEAISFPKRFLSLKIEVRRVAASTNCKRLKDFRTHGNPFSSNKKMML